jgi:hypothetical protein
MSAPHPVSASAVPPLSPNQLVDFTRFLAEEVRDGVHIVDFDDQDRWSRRIYRDGRVDVWLMGWMPEQETQLHDHGGSSGAFTVVSGVLSEATYIHPPRGISTGPRAGTLRDRTHGPDRSIGFDGTYVHDVRNLSDSPSISVHAYSPPLTWMSYYDLEGGALVHFASLDTDDPEAKAPACKESKSVRAIA